MDRRTGILVLLLTALTAGLGACSTTPEVSTLGSLDIRQADSPGNEVFVKPKSEAEVKQAYYEYISKSSSGESSRLLAMSRLAEMEIQRLNSMLKEDDGTIEDAVYRESLSRTLELLDASLREFPDAANNHETLYQLAHTHEQLGNHDSSLAALEELTQRYPDSRHYAEAQFRLGEAAFAEGDYIGAEDAYSEALFSDETRTFYERSLFKRGWSRYKQGLYIEAADDYLAALKNRPFSEYHELSGSEKDELDEYFRAIGLAFASLQNPDILQNFFVAGTDRKYLYHVYRVISETYREQERFSDGAIALAQFVELNPDDPNVPLARLGIVDTWRDGGFRQLFNESLEDLYTSFHPGAEYWQSRTGPVHDAVAEALRRYSLQLASFRHERFARTRQDDAFAAASTWYTRYLEHYSAYAQQDKVFRNYAELLADQERNEEALHYFELAAYDGEIVLDKDAAYATIVLARDLHKNSNSSKWLDKQLHYALTSVRLYPNESRYHAAALNAAESAFESQRFDKAIELATVIPDNAAPNHLYQASVLVGLAYRESGRPGDAEAVFQDLLTQNLDRGQRREQQDNLALAIYQQAEQARDNNQPDLAMEHFARVAAASPESDIAPAALYDALLLSVESELWQRAITYAEHFQERYRKHDLSKDVTRHLSAAYLNAGDDAKAARAFEDLASRDNSREVKMAALWQAAELYESRNELDSAIRSYRSYANTYTRPFPQYMEAMYKLIQLYEQVDEPAKRRFWRNKISEADQKASKSQKTERTNRLAATVLLNLARERESDFQRQKLHAPLADNLRKKKQLLQESTALYGRASGYSFPDITTEATHSIGRIYQEFARALLDSERPAELAGEELMQYNILLEDQAFPFEEKAIEFYEVNLARTRDGASTRWIRESHARLVSLFPARYNRKGKLGIYRGDIP
ncbi:tetratricopeptide repeat protein [Gilvimarinus sp. F26214L]|uniref:tetratricopeptide repeat protein n=1 Tax=Gilvimarinus sp. DZF01 TaxID=3461371 RepID=UPI00404599BF